MNNVIGVGKYIFAIPFLIFGILHFAGADDMAAMAPGGKMMVYFTGLALIAAAISIFIGKLDKLACLLLALMLVLFIVIVHAPGLGSEDTMQMSMMAVLKDLGLAGGALLCAGNAKDDSIVG